MPTMVELSGSIANSPVAYFVLFILLLMYELKTSSERELKMREQLDKTIPILEVIVTKVDRIEKKLDMKEGE